MTTRVLMTGSDGFVGPHVENALRRVCGAEIEIIATSKVGGTHPVFGKMDALDVTDAAAIRSSIAHTEPTHVIHLAASQRLMPRPPIQEKHGPSTLAEPAISRRQSSNMRQVAGC
jgi:dTDP-4-dehydrorhamnose reductase